MLFYALAVDDRAIGAAGVFDVYVMQTFHVLVARYGNLRVFATDRDIVNLDFTFRPAANGVGSLFQGIFIHYNSVSSVY
jgi:hypothetical protein